MKRKYKEIASLIDENNIEVRFAKSKLDIEQIGIHIMEPSIEDLLEAVSNAIKHGCNIVMIHSRLTWPRDY